MFIKVFKRFFAAFLAFKNPELLRLYEYSGALSKHFFKCLAIKEIAHAQNGQLFSMIFIDLDNFKEFNDTYGHVKGDDYLKRFVETIKKCCRSYDLVGSWGGDEFVLLLPRTTADQAQSIVKRINSFFPFFSWGISIWSEGDDLKSLVERADQRMFEAKRAKKAGDR
ncbi:MAG: GGDEF domain-containing protein [bacterium]